MLFAVSFPEITVADDTGFLLEIHYAILLHQQCPSFVQVSVLPV